TILGNAVHGIETSGAVNGITIGGTGTTDRNVVSGNTQHGILLGSGALGVTVQGNRIGTDAAGGAPLGNQRYGVQVGAGASAAAIVIGGTDPAAGNLVSGNGWDGLAITAGGATVQGNRIGTDAAGNLAVPNRGSAGVLMSGTANGVVFGGAATGAGNQVSGNTLRGILVYAGSHTFQGNRIGTDAAGNAALRNNEVGLVIDSGAGPQQVGGRAAGEGNTISGNLYSGIWINSATAGGTVIEGNRIGVGVDGTTVVANGWDGVSMRLGTTGNVRIGGTQTGAGNVIAGNTGAGVRIDIGTEGNAILGNSIYGNGQIGIDLNIAGNAFGTPDGVSLNDGAKIAGRPNRQMDFPTITSARARGSQLTLAGYVGTAAGPTTFGGARVELFVADGDASGYGEGRTYLGTITTNADGSFSGTVPMTVSGLRLGSQLTATATDGSNNTSEFGPAFAGVLIDQIVNHVGDAVDANPGDGLCETATAGQCTLRAAIQEANAWSGSGNPITIAFGLPGCPATVSACTITPASALPNVTRSGTVIDAQTQTGWTLDPVVVLTGGSAGGVSGLTLAAADVTVRGLVING
ncbi:MAG: beta strand repeat-containing protein, partial [Burkholderiaceae bacterium]